MYTIEDLKAIRTRLQTKLTFMQGETPVETVEEGLLCADTNLYTFVYGLYQHLAEMEPQDSIALLSAVVLSQQIYDCDRLIERLERKEENV